MSLFIVISPYVISFSIQLMAEYLKTETFSAFYQKLFKLRDKQENTDRSGGSKVKVEVIFVQ